MARDGRSDAAMCSRQYGMATVASALDAMGYAHLLRPHRRADHRATHGYNQPDRSAHPADRMAQSHRTLAASSADADGIVRALDHFSEHPARQLRAAPRLSVRAVLHARPVAAPLVAADDAA